MNHGKATRPPSQTPCKGVTLVFPDIPTFRQKNTNLPPLLIQHSEAWEPPQFQEERSRSEKAILGALGEFRSILGAALAEFKKQFSE